MQAAPMPAQHNYRAYILEGPRVKSPLNLFFFVLCKYDLDETYCGGQIS